MNIPQEITAQVTFYVKLKDVDEIAVQVKAAELDEQNGVGPEDYPTGYTFEQAFQIIWHLEPEWVHAHLINGWTLDKVRDDEGLMRWLWPDPERSTT